MNVDVENEDEPMADEPIPDASAQSDASLGLINDAISRVAMDADQGLTALGGMLDSLRSAVDLVDESYQRTYAAGLQLVESAQNAAAAVQDVFAKARRYAEAHPVQSLLALALVGSVAALNIGEVLGQLSDGDARRPDGSGRSGRRAGGGSRAGARRH